MARKALYATVSTGNTKKIKKLKAYYYQGGKWYPVKPVKGTF